MAEGSSELGVGQYPDVLLMIRFVIAAPSKNRKRGLRVGVFAVEVTSAV
jgi:hypothetical protein